MRLYCDACSKNPCECGRRYASLPTETLLALHRLLHEELEARGVLTRPSAGGTVAP